MTNKAYKYLKKMKKINRDSDQEANEISNIDWTTSNVLWSADGQFG